MKKSVSIINSLLLLFLSAKAQSIKETQNSAIFRIIYRAEQQAIKNGDPFVITDTMALDIENSYSVYYDWRLRTIDSTDNSNFLKMKRLRFSTDKQELERRLELNMKVDETIGGRKAETAYIFKERLSNEVITLGRDNDLKYKYKVAESIVLDWEILADTATILNYHCMKAVTQFRGRRYYAWFTIDIPINDGPWKFHGLPGMIMKIEDSDNVFCMTAIGLEKIDSPILKVNDILNNTFETIDYKLFNKLKQNKYQKIGYGFYESSNSIIFFYNINNPITYPEMEIGE